MDRFGAILLCGGQSTRMGRPKAWLPLGAGNETMLARILQVLAAVAEPVVVVAAQRQELPPLPTSVELVRDEVDNRGPLGGLAAGLAAVAGRVDVVYLSACDVPFLSGAFVQRVVQLLRESSAEEIAVPCVAGRLHPLAAAYRTSLLALVSQLLGANRLHMTDLFQLVPTRVISAEELRAADAGLASLRNINTPEDYAELLEVLASGG